MLSFGVERSVLIYHRDFLSLHCFHSRLSSISDKVASIRSQLTPLPSMWFSACERLILLEANSEELRDYAILLYHCGYYEEALQYLNFYNEAKVHFFFNMCFFWFDHCSILHARINENLVPPSYNAANIRFIGQPSRRWCCWKTHCSTQPHFDGGRLEEAVWKFPS